MVGEGRVQDSSAVAVQGEAGMVVVAMEGEAGAAVGLEEVVMAEAAKGGVAMVGVARGPGSREEERRAAATAATEGGEHTTPNRLRTGDCVQCTSHRLCKRP